jgi:hypothetical protein
MRHSARRPKTKDARVRDFAVTEQQGYYVIALLFWILAEQKWHHGSRGSAIIASVVGLFFWATGLLQHFA